MTRDVWAFLYPLLGSIVFLLAWAVLVWVAFRRPVSPGTTGNDGERTETIPDGGERQ